MTYMYCMISYVSLLILLHSRTLPLPVSPQGPQQGSLLLTEEADLRCLKMAIYPQHSPAIINQWIQRYPMFKQTYF